MKNKLNIKAMFRIAGNPNRARSAKVPLLIIVLTVIIGISFTACSNDDDDSSDSAGGLTITGLGDYNGKYAAGIGSVDGSVYALSSINLSTGSGKGSKITNGSVNLNVYTAATGAIFNGNGFGVIVIYIKNSDTFSPQTLADNEMAGEVHVTFSSGKAKGELIPYDELYGSAIVPVTQIP